MSWQWPVALHTWRLGTWLHDRVRRFRRPYTRPQRVTCVLTLVGLFATAAAVLSVTPHLPYVTVTLDVTRVGFDLPRPADTSRSLLDPALQISSVTFTDVASATQADAAATGRISIESHRDASERAPLGLDIELREPVAIEITRTRANSVWIEFTRFDPARAPFQATIYPDAEHQLAQADIALPDAWSARIRQTLDPLAAPLELRATGPKPAIGIQIATSLQDEWRVARLATPGPGGRQIHSSEGDAHVLALANDLFLVERLAAKDVPILHPFQPFLLDRIDLFDASSSDYLPASYVRTGRIDFTESPGRFREVRSPMLLAIEPAEMAIHSLALTPDSFRVSLAGRARELRLGPDLESMDDLRPSLFQHLLDQESRRAFAIAVIAALATILAAWIQQPVRSTDPQETPHAP